MLGPGRCTAQRAVPEDHLGKTVPEEQAQDLLGNRRANLTGQEAHGRYSFEEKRRFLDISLGSCKEVQSHLYVALDLAYVGKQEFEETYHQAEVVARLITGALDNLDRQIADRVGNRLGPRQRSRSR